MIATKSVPPVGREVPVTASPHPMIIAPSPSSAYPDVARRGAGGCDLNNWWWHWPGNHCRSRYHRDRWRGHHRDRKWTAEIDTEMDAGVYTGDSQDRQG